MAGRAPGQATGPDQDALVRGLIEVMGPHNSASITSS